MNFYSLKPHDRSMLDQIMGPILILGAGGFIGSYMLSVLRTYRHDVYGVVRDSKDSWRFKISDTPPSSLLICDISKTTQLKKLLDDVQPQTIFNFATYGAYESQKNVGKIYKNNLIAHVNLLDLLVKRNISAYVFAGTSSEYGLNSEKPHESAYLEPNSHYAISKAASSQLIHWYSQSFGLPAIHLRLYSVYGPHEDPNRLVPRLAQCVRNRRLPPFAQKDISRDFVYIADVVGAFLSAATHASTHKGSAFNIGTGKKTTLGKLATIALRLARISVRPKFTEFPNRTWDTALPWQSDARKAKKILGWRSSVPLEEGLGLVIKWQNKILYDVLFPDYE